MSSSSKKRQTMAKISRERTLQEKRALKVERKANRKLAAATGVGENGAIPAESDGPHGDSPGVEQAGRFGELTPA